MEDLVEEPVPEVIAIPTVVQEEVIQAEAGLQIILQVVVVPLITERIKLINKVHMLPKGKLPLHLWVKGVFQHWFLSM
jgi:hypothetical protein